MQMLLKTIFTNKTAGQMSKLFTLILSLLLVVSPGLFAQKNVSDVTIQRYTDSLRLVPAGNKHAELLIKLAVGYCSRMPKKFSNLEIALKLSKEAEKYSRSINDTVNERDSYIQQMVALIDMADVKKREGGDCGKEMLLIKETQAKAYKLAEKTGPEAVAKLNVILGEVSALIVQEDPEVSLGYYRKALQHYRGTRDKTNEAKVLLAMAKVLTDSGEMLKGDTVALQCAAVARSIPDNKILQQAYTELGMIRSHLGNFTDGLKFGIEAEKLADLQKDTSAQMVMLYMGIGVSYETSGNLDAALVYHKKALALNEKYHYGQYTHQVAGNVAKLLAKKDPRTAIAFLEDFLRKYPVYPMDLENIHMASRLLFAYTALKEYKSAQKYCDQLLALSPRLPTMSPDQTVILVPVIRFLIASSQYKEAAKHLPRYTAIVETGQILPLMREAYAMKAKVDSAQGDFRAAFADYKRYHQLTDSISGIEKTKEMTRLQVQYETEKKNRNIDLLTKQSQLQQAQLKQAAMMRNVTFGSILLLLVIVALLFNQYRIKQRSNRAINNKNLALQHLVDEKEWLLKEVHHRVKNNLQTIVSLLESQSAYLHSEAYQAIQESQHRIHSMSLIHQKLYQADNLAAIDLSTYLPELTNYLRSSFDVGQRISFHFDIIPVELDVSRAIPVGLIVNEIITNAIKYAFPPGHQDNTISITVRKENTSDIELTVADNGVGIPADFDISKSRSLGMRLMMGLTDDLNGEFSIRSKNGTTVQIRFPEDMYIKDEIKKVRSVLSASA